MRRMLTLQICTSIGVPYVTHFDLFQAQAILLKNLIAEGPRCCLRIWTPASRCDQLGNTSANLFFPNEALPTHTKNLISIPRLPPQFLSVLLLFFKSKIPLHLLIVLLVARRMFYFSPIRLIRLQMSDFLYLPFNNPQRRSMNMLHSAVGGKIHLDSNDMTICNAGEICWHLTWTHTYTLTCRQTNAHACTHSHTVT